MTTPPPPPPPPPGSPPPGPNGRSEPSGGRHHPQVPAGGPPAPGGAPAPTGPGGAPAPTGPGGAPAPTGAGGAPARTRTRTPLSRARSPYGLWIALFSVAIFVAPNLVLVGIAGMEAVETVPMESDGLIVLNLLVGLVLQLIVFGIALLPLLAAGRPYSRLFGPTRTTATMVVVGLGTGVGVAVLAYLLNAIAVLLAGTEEPVQQQLLEDALAGGLPLVLVVVLAVVVAPVVEEVIFRGVLFRAMSDRINLGVALVLSSAIFALIHIEVLFSQPVALVGLFTVGLLLAVAYHLTGNLMVPILGHAVFNAISLSLTVVVDRLDLDDMVELAGLTLPVPL